MAHGPAAQNATTSAKLVELLGLEREVRLCPSREVLAFTIVNRTRQLLPYSQAVLVTWRGTTRPTAVAAADVPAIDHDAPYIRWLEGAANDLLSRPEGESKTKPRAVSPEDLSPGHRAEWNEWTTPHVLWIPMALPNAPADAGLWLARQAPWRPEETVLAERLAETYGHAWSAFEGGRRPRWRLGKRWGWAAAAALLIGGAIPVQQSVLAPAEIVATDPYVVTAPIDGVISRILVRPNEPVEAGHTLLEFEDTELRAKAEIAAQELAVIQAELRGAEQGSFSDPRSSAQVALLKAQLGLRTAEARHAQERLARSAVLAERAGVAVFRNANDWIGRPVTIGQRVMTIADPRRVEVEARLPVADAIALSPDAEVRVFLDAEPLRSLSARLRLTSFEPEVGPDGIASYRLSAVLDDAELTDRPPRLGLQGTAKIYGQSVPVAFYLLRRPIAALRQAIGL